jgi:hypothetical protein
MEDYGKMVSGSHNGDILSTDSLLSFSYSCFLSIS